MLLTGTYKRSLDDKQRIAIPKKIRDQLAGSSQPNRLYVAPGTDGSLALYAEEAFSRMGEQLAVGSPTGPDVRAFSRLFYSQAECLEMDSQGRVRISPELWQLAGLDKEAVLVGVRDHMELWDSARWQSYLGEKQRQYDELAERAFRIG